MNSIVRARAPLRLGLAGGGSDISPFCDIHGGAVLNATINRYALASWEPAEQGVVEFHAIDLKEIDRMPVSERLDTAVGLRLHRGVYNRMIADFNGGKSMSVRVMTYVDSPLGSGLGSSSALVVALVKLFAEVLSAPLGEYDIARLAFDIERIDLALNGGRQDQYAATFGGFNFMEFGANERVIVNPLRIGSSVICELEASMVLFFTGASRLSAQVIETQSKAVQSGGSSLEAMHQLKNEAIAMKEALLFGKTSDVAEVLRRGWIFKKATSPAVSTPVIEEVFESAMAAGALAGKVSGAGGGGFMLFIVDPVRRADVIESLAQKSSGRVAMASFTTEGARSWRTR